MARSSINIITPNSIRMGIELRTEIKERRIQKQYSINGVTNELAPIWGVSPSAIRRWVSKIEKYNGFAALSVMPRANPRDKNWMVSLDREQIKISEWLKFIRITENHYWGIERRIKREIRREFNLLEKVKIKPYSAIWDPSSPIAKYLS